MTAEAVAIVLILSLVMIIRMYGTCILRKNVCDLKSADNRECRLFHSITPISDCHLFPICTFGTAFTRLVRAVNFVCAHVLDFKMSIIVPIRALRVLPRSLEHCVP